MAACRLLWLMRMRCKHVGVVAALVLAAGCASDPSDDDGSDPQVLDDEEAVTNGSPALGAHGVIEVGGRPTFPIILSMPPPIGTVTPTGRDGLDEVVAAGVNMLKTGPGTAWDGQSLAAARAWTAAAAARGVTTWVNLWQLASASPGSTDATTLHDVVLALAGDPGLGMWKAADEPWWNGESASSLRNAYQVAHSLDPKHAWTLIEAPEGTATNLAPYSAVTDVHGVDIYPVAYGVANPDLHQVGAWTKLIRSVTPDQSIIVTLQICTSGSDNPNGSGYVLPTRAQERYMIYDAIINGARGLSFFGGTTDMCMTARDSALGWNWTFWNTVLRDLIREIGPTSALYPALLAPGSGPTLVHSDTSTELLTRQVYDAADHRHLWVIAARRGAGTKQVTISHIPTVFTSGTVYGEGRTLAVHGGVLTDSFGKWGVHVYHFVD
jgi:hypothetical protein